MFDLPSIFRRRKIYIDLGSNEGRTVREFVREHPGWRVFAFEPTPELAQRLRDEFAANRSVTVIDAAAAPEGGYGLLWRGIDSSQSNTLLVGKRESRSRRVDYDPDEACVVAQIDFARWLKSQTSRWDRIIVKMDIEGSEYAVLKRMLKLRVLSRLEEIRVEWHQNLFPSISRHEHKRIKSAVARQTRLIDWE